MKISIEEAYGYVSMTTSMDAEDYLTDTEVEYLHKLTGRIQKRIKQGRGWKEKAAIKRSKIQRRKAD